MVLWVWNQCWSWVNISAIISYGVVHFVEPSCAYAWWALKGTRGVWSSNLTYLQSFLIIWVSIYKTIPKPYVFWNLGLIERHCQCSSKNLTTCSEMPASCNLQRQHQVTVNVILTALLNRFQCHSPGIHKRAIPPICGGRNFYLLFSKKKKI